MVSGGSGFDDHKGFSGFQGREHGGKKLSVVVGESLSYWLHNMLVRSFLGKIFSG